MQAIPTGKLPRAFVGRGALQGLALGVEVGPAVTVSRRLGLDRTLGHDGLILRVERDGDPLARSPVIDPRVTVHIPTADGRGQLIAAAVQLFLSGSQFDEIHGTRSWSGTTPRARSGGRSAAWQRGSGERLRRSWCQFRASLGAQRGPRALQQSAS